MSGVIACENIQANARKEPTPMANRIRVTVWNEGRHGKKSPEIAVELETVRELNSMIEEMFSLAKKELDCLRKKELPLSILHGCEKDIQNNHKSL